MCGGGVQGSFENHWQKLVYGGCGWWKMGWCGVGLGGSGRKFVWQVWVFMVAVDGVRTARFVGAEKWGGWRGPRGWNRRFGDMAVSGAPGPAAEIPTLV